MRNDLPENCLATLPGTGELVILKRGETGYYHTDWDTGDKVQNLELADYHNRRRGINPAQVEAMQMGSMCGFHVPGADPQIYFDQAKLIRSFELDTKSTIKGPDMIVSEPVRGTLHQYQVAGYDSFYLEPSAVPESIMGAGCDHTVWMDMVQGKSVVPVAAEWQPDGSFSMGFEVGAVASDVEVNANYQIIAKVQVGPVEYALGEHSGKFPSFVTWERTPSNDGDGPPNYYWGHYFDSRKDAIRDFCHRAEEKNQMLAQNRKPSIKAQLAAKPVPGDQPAAKSKDREVR